MKKGQIVNPVGYRKYLIEFIEGKNGELFTAGEAIDAVRACVCDASPKRTRNVISYQLCKWTRAGLLLRDHGEDGMFRYLGFVRPISERLTYGEVAAAVWSVLLAATTPMRRRDICNVINPSAGERLSGDVGTLLTNWHRDKALTRDGKRGQYTYRLTDEARVRGVRPFNTYNRKPHPIPSDGNMAHLT